MSITVDVVFDGEVLRPQAPDSLTPNQHYSVTIAEPADGSTSAGDVWSVLKSLTRTFDGPTDWSTEHDQLEARSGPLQYGHCGVA